MTGEEILHEMRWRFYECCILLYCMIACLWSPFGDVDLAMERIVIFTLAVRCLISLFYDYYTHFNNNELSTYSF